MSEEELIQLYVIIIAQILESMVGQATQELDMDNLTVFDSNAVPGITISSYLQRIMSNPNATSRSMIMGIWYVNTLWENNLLPSSVTKFNVHRLIGISIMIASKFYDEVHFSNNIWGEILGLELSEVNTLEQTFLTLIDFEVNLKIEWFIQMLNTMLNFAITNNVIELRVGKIILKTIYNAALEEAKDGHSDD